MQEDGTKHWVFHGNPSIPDWQWKDGNKAVYFMDKDGMLTGTVNASVVSDFPIYKGPECLSRPDWGDLLICPYRYVKVRVRDRPFGERETDRDGERETDTDTWFIVKATDPYTKKGGICKTKQKRLDWVTNVSYTSRSTFF